MVEDVIVRPSSSPDGNFLNVAQPSGRLSDLNPTFSKERIVASQTTVRGGFCTTVTLTRMDRPHRPIF